MFCLFLALQLADGTQGQGFDPLDAKVVSLQPIAARFRKEEEGGGRRGVDTYQDSPRKRRGVDTYQDSARKRRGVDTYQDSHWVHLGLWASSLI